MLHTHIHINIYILYFIRLYEPSFVQKISCHQVTEEPLPLDIITNIRNSKTHLAGYNLCKEMYLSQFDLELYSG